MAGHVKKRGAASELVPREGGAQDLTAGKGLTKLSGERVVDLARKTLDAAERLIETWSDLEPLVKLLIGKVKTFAEKPEVETVVATSLLRDAASVSRSVANAATSVLRASEGQVRLAVLLEGPTPERKTPGAMTERQMANVVIEACKRMHAEAGVCPVCQRAPAVITVSANGKEERP